MILDPWRNRLWSYITCLMITMQVTKVHGYKPVIILHGILDAAADLKHLENFIKKVFMNLNGLVYNFILRKLRFIVAVWTRLYIISITVV